MQVLAGDHVLEADVHVPRDGRSLGHLALNLHLPKGVGIGRRQVNIESLYGPCSQVKPLKQLGVSENTLCQEIGVEFFVQQADYVTTLDDIQSKEWVSF